EGPGGDGARRGEAAAAALHRVVLPRGLSAARGDGAPARAAALRDPARPRPDPEPRPGDRDRRAGPPALRADRLREGSDRAAGPAPRGLRLPRSPPPRRDARPHPRAPPRPPAPWCRPRRRARPRRGAPAHLLPRARDPGREHHAGGGAARHLEEDALRRDDGGRGDTPPELRAIPRLPPPRRGRALAGGDPRFPGVRVDQPRPRTFRPRLRDREGRPRAPRGGPVQAARVDREDPRRRPRPADQGDLLLGPPRRGTTPPGGGREVEVAAELG